MYVPLVNGHADLDRNLVVVDGETVRLTPNESRLFQYLVAHTGRTVDYDELLREVFGYAPSVRSRTVVSTMQRLRKKVEADPAEPVHLQNVYGRGYRFEPVGVADALLGRAAELARLSSEQVGGRVWVSAPGGFGKTALVRRYAQTVAGDALWVDLTDVQGEVGFLTAAARALGLGRLADLASLDVAIAAREVALVVCDAAEHLVEVLTRWFSRRPPEIPVLVTSRLPCAGEPTVELGPLSEEAAAALLSRSLPDPLPEARLRTLLEGLDGVPLALELAGAQLGGVGAEGLLQGLDDLSALLTGGAGRHSSMRGVLDWSWERTPDDLQQALVAIAPSRGGLRLGDAAALVGAGGVATLRRLHQWGWAQLGEQRIRLLDPIRRFVEGQADLTGARKRHRGRMLDQLRAREHDVLAGRAADFERAEWGNLEVAFDSAVADGDPAAAELVLLLGPVLSRTIPVREGLRWLDRAAGLAEGEWLGDVLVARARLWLRTSLDTAALDLARAEEVGVRRPGWLRLRQAKLMQARGELAASTAAFREALAQLTGPIVHQTQVELSYNLLQLGEVEEAKGLLREVLARARVEDAPSSAMLALGTLGSLYTAQDQFDEALRAYEESLQISVEHHQPETQAGIHHLLGNLHLYLGDADRAAEAWQACISVGSRIGARVTIASARANIALLDIARRALPQAADRLRAALATFDECGVAPSAAFTKLQLGRVAALEGRWSDAERYWADSELDLPGDIAWMLGVERCIAWVERGDVERAEEALAAGAAGTDAGSRAGRSLAAAMCAATRLVAGETPSAHRLTIEAALAEADAIPPDPMIQDLAARVRQMTER